MRLFVAAWPPPEVVASLAALPRPDVAGLRWTRPDQWHVTLRFLGHVEGVEPVVAATRSIGEPPEDRPFQGHVTLARVAGRARVDLRPLTGTALSASWPVYELTLVSSRLGPSGPRYEVVGRFPLGG